VALHAKHLRFYAKLIKKYHAPKQCIVLVMLIWLFVEFLSVIYAKYSIISDNWPQNHHSACFAPRFVGALPFEPNH
jgi:hypothetical protein